MKILLIQPPVQDFYRTAIRIQPIGLAYLAASLKANGHEVAILDCQTEQRRSIPVPPELSYLKRFYPFQDRSPFKLYSGYYHFGMGWDEIRKTIEKSNADVFGVSSSFTPYHQGALEIARIIKRCHPQKNVVMGGSHVTSDPKEVLESSFVDYAVLGEGEFRFPLLLEKIQKGGTKSLREMDGIGHRVNGRIEVNPPETFIEDLDGLPHPARELLPLDRYRMGRKKSTMIITSRGCPHRCAYCSAHQVMGTVFRARSPESILQEMLACRQRYGIQAFDIEDDNFTYDLKRAKGLMELIISTFGEGAVELSAMNGISFASLDDELLRLMKRAGFNTVNLSFVSTAHSLKEKMERPGLGTDFNRILEAVEKTNLHAIVYAIYGMPGQTIEEMVSTLIYLMGKRVLIGPSIYYPTPGTPLFGQCKREGVLPLDPSQWRSSAFPVETKSFSRLDLVTLFRLVRTVNFIKGKIDEKECDEGMTWRELALWLRNRERKVEAKGEDKRVEGDTLETGRIGWTNLLRRLVEEKSFVSVKSDPKAILMVNVIESSRKVLDCFFEKAWERPILGSRNV